MRTNIVKLGLTHLKNELAEALYLYGSYDITRPITIFALVNERCNLKCVFCEFWERDKEERVPELNIDQWQELLLDLKGFSKNFSINFSGGEPLLKHGFLDLLVWCGRNEINAGFTTNGSLFTKNKIKKIIEANPLNVNVSIDSHIAEVHDGLRQVKGIWHKASQGVQALREARDKAGHTFPIVIKPIVNKRNYNTLPDIIDFALSVGATGVNFQPITNLSCYIKENLWVEPDQYPALKKSIDKLIEMKHSGSPIINSEKSLNLLIDHFNEAKADKQYLPCRIGMRNLFIKPDGSTMLCWEFEDIGNIAKEGVKGVWFSKTSKKVRKETVDCQKLCLLTCASQKTIFDKLKMAVVLFGKR
jgi:MoaA/NifB/PqqE/SkfB family radical SAM enzyme